MEFPSKFIQLMSELKISLPIEELITFLSESQRQCLFIKNEQSAYCYANQNYIQLMGLKNLNQLQCLTDYDLSKNRSDADLYRAHDQYVLEENKHLAR